MEYADIVLIFKEEKKAQMFLNELTKALWHAPCTHKLLSRIVEALFSLARIDTGLVFTIGGKDKRRRLQYERQSLVIGLVYRAQVRIDEEPKKLVYGVTDTFRELMHNCDCLAGESRMHESS
ncbi:hypothetical protein CLF_111756 [Clonorchis sinensis]|uniref:Uncharacterized protein n=1 Tax=Clonorchis sinensis TaxID=79923 RepID=G7YVA9_CLOSI|nr:hypothetical protein CLF_111756 [Clonorchis sinensis]